jgi:hypothetical protein
MAGTYLRPRAGFVLAAITASIVSCRNRITNSDPAFLRILARSERYKARYDAAKQGVPRVEVI